LTPLARRWGWRQRTIAKLEQRIGKKDILLAFDSLTSPYLFNKEEVFRFIRLCLVKFAAKGNSVLALVDEGCGKEEDLVAMMSVADGIIRMEIEDSSRMITVVKHPGVSPTTLELPTPQRPMISFESFDPNLVRRSLGEVAAGDTPRALRTGVGDSVNMFWKNLAFWSGMLWDAKRFPRMMYEFDRTFHARAREAIALAPWYKRLAMRLLVPKSMSEPKDMKKFASRFTKTSHVHGVWEYLEGASSRDEHYFRVHENASCWTFDHVGARLAFPDLGAMAGILRAVEEQEREWNLLEVKCIGMGAPYCEFKAVPGETDELKRFLEGIDSSVVEQVHDRLMEQLTGFLIRGESLPERPRLGSGVVSNVMLMVTSAPALVSDRYRMALRMGGARMGKEVGEHLMNAEVGENEAIRRVIGFMNHCKVGTITLGETIRMKENCETFGLDAGEPCCFFTTGFLNGLFSAVKNQHVREIKCIAAGDPYCEWEIV
jgi:predicted hydrocarbon binding protein